MSGDLILKDRIIDNNLRNIKKSFLRFLSLLVMAALGMFAFAGLMAVAPDMINSLDHFLDDRNTYDIRIISDMGLDPEDVDAVRALPAIENAEGVLYRDSPVFTAAAEGLVNINSLPGDINIIQLKSGRLPEAKNEIAVEENFLKVNKVGIGDFVKIDDKEGFYETDVMITGVVDSPLYYNSVDIDINRGNTNVGSGIINYFAYMPESNFKADYISVIYATVKGASELETGSDGYKDLINNAMDEIEGIKDARQKSRYDSIMKTADEKIDKESRDARIKLADAKQQLDEAKAELEDAAAKIAEGEKELTDAKTELDAASLQLEDAKIQLADKERELENGRMLLNDAGRQIGEKEAQLQEGGRLLDEGLSTLNDKSAQLEAGKAKLSEGKAQLDEKQKQADEGAALIASAEKELEKGAADLKKAKADAAAGKEELENKQKLLEEGEAKLETGRKELEEEKQLLDNAKTALNNIQDEYDSIVSSEHLTEDIINSEMERLKTDIDAVKGILEKLASDYRSGVLTPERAREIIKQAIESYKREPTVLEKVVFDKVAMTILEPVISEGESAYNKGLAELEAGEVQLAEGKKALEEGRRQYEEGLKQIAEGEKKLQDGRKELDSKKQELESGLKQLRAAFAEYEAARKTLSEGEDLLKKGFDEYNKNKAAYDEGKALLEKGKEEYLNSAEQLLNGERLIEEAKAQLEAGEKQYREGLAAYNEGKDELEAGKAEYEAGYSLYSSGLAEYEAGRANFDEEISKARKGLLDLKLPTWYTYDRTGYQTYADFFDSAGSIRNLSTVFPIMFFLVAILVSLTSMSRMVEMDRIEIGTLKSMGFSREKIISKYAFFSVSATFAGALLGGVLGLIILPSVIFSIYGILFDIPKFYLGPNWVPTIIGFAAVMFFVVGSGMLKAVQVMREKPASLLRPKSPKPGKRVLLERIGPIWRKMRFSDKITVRNLFRYKRRFFVTVFGIMGCTALILCGFGIKDSIVDLPEKQFGTVFNQDAMVYLTGMDNSTDDSETLAEIFDEDGITGYTESQRIKCTCDDYEANLITFEKPEDIEKVINFKDADTGETITPVAGEAVITSKLSRLTGIKKGDEITLTDLDHRTHTYTVSGITENYFEHYIIIDKDTQEKFAKYAPNLFYLNTTEMTAEQKEALTKRLLEHSEVLNVTFKDKLVSNANNMFTSLNKVVVILIILSAALSLVVLYNLSNININERHREIATLKVLGFNDKEVDDYINRENIIFTIIGIGAGLLLGILITKLVVSTVEIEKASFINHIKPLSYVYAAAMSTAFTLLVNFITHFNLRRINMIDSMKSVD